MGFDAAAGIDGALSFNVFGASIHLSGLAVAALVGIILNAIFPGNDYIFDDENGEETGVEFKL